MRDTGPRSISTSSCGILEAALKTALSAEANIEGEPATHKWGKIAHLADPFGHGLCLIEFIGRGYDEIAPSRSLLGLLCWSFRGSAGPARAPTQNGLRALHAGE